MDKQVDQKRIEELTFLRTEELTKEDLSIEKVYDYFMARAYSQGEIKHLLENSPIEFLSKDMEHMVEEERIPIDYIPTVFLEDYTIAAAYVRQDCSNIVMLPARYRDDEEFITEAVHSDGRVLSSATERIRNIESILNIALHNTKKSFKYFPDKFKTRENCIIALTGSYPDYAENWQHVPYPLRLDEDFIKEVASLSPKIYQYLDDSVKNNYEITQLFLTKEGGNLQYVSEEHKNDITLVAPVIDKYPMYLRFAGDKLKNDPEFILPVIKKTPSEIHSCGNEIKSNLEVAKYICNIRTYEPPISFFIEEIKSDVTVAMISLLRMPESMNYISKTLSSSAEFVSSYIEKSDFNPAALHYIANDLKSDLDIMIKAYNRDPVCLEYASKKLLRDERFLSYIFDPECNGRWTSDMALFANLKAVNVCKGEEYILLMFCEHTKFDINDIQTKADILRQIKDNEFVETLRDQEDLYAYLKSASLMRDLQNNLVTQDVVVKKPKI